MLCGPLIAAARDPQEAQRQFEEHDVLREPGETAQTATAALFVLGRVGKPRTFQKPKE